MDTVTTQPTAKRVESLANTPQPMVSGVEFQEKCWECKFGKHVKSNNHYGRCHEQRKHRGPDWRDDPRFTQAQLSLLGWTNKRIRQPSVRIDQAMNKSTKQAHESVASRSVAAEAQAADVLQCVHCNKSDGVDQMVSCSQCKQLSHYFCSNAPEELREQQQYVWHCDSCKTSMVAQQQVLSAALRIATRLNNSAPQQQVLSNSAPQQHHAGPLAINSNNQELVRLGLDTVTTQPTAKRVKSLANTPQPMVSGMNFQDKCWECKFGKHVKSNNHSERCREQRKHRGPDWRDDPRCTQAQLSLPGWTNKRTRQPSVRIDQAMNKSAKRALSFEEKAASSSLDERVVSRSLAAEAQVADLLQCVFCKESDGADQMLSCSQCKQLSHYFCSNAPEELCEQQQYVWHCDSCKTSMVAQQQVLSAALRIATRLNNSAPQQHHAGPLAINSKNLSIQIKPAECKLQEEQ